MRHPSPLGRDAGQTQSPPSDFAQSLSPPPFAPIVLVPPVRPADVRMTNPGLESGRDNLITAQSLGFGHVISYSLDGTGDNPNLPNDAIVGAEQLRLAPAHFAAGTVNTPIDGPNPRTISNVILGSAAPEEDPRGHSAYVYAFGQFVDHDIDLTTNQSGVNAATLSITAPRNDPVLPAGSSITITRAAVNAADGHALNGVTSVLDLSQIYGSDRTTATSLRGEDGKLLTSDGDNPPIVNGRFVGGDVRASENPDLTAVDALFVREHNYWANALKTQTPSLTSDQIYDMARAITTAEYQNIVYHEYLPSILGPNARLTPYRGFDPNVSTQIFEEFSAAAFRFGHATISTTETKLANDGTALESTDLLTAMMSATSTITANGGFDALLRNLADDQSAEVSVRFPSDLLNMPNPSGGGGFFDLGAVDIMRECDLGLATLNDTRAALGLSRYTSFSQITSEVRVAAQLQAIFGSVDNVDLFVGGLAENHLRGGMLGETFAAIIALQFENLRDGDRLFFENQGFTPQLMAQIENTTLATLILRDTDTDAIQQNVMIAADRHTSDVAPQDSTRPQLIIGIDDDSALIRGVDGVVNTLVAGAGANQLLVGAGPRTDFVFTTSDVRDRVIGFRPGMDHIIFDHQPMGVTAQNISIERAPAFGNGQGGAILHLGEASVILIGVDARSLSASDFIVNDG